MKNLFVKMISALLIVALITSVCALPTTALAADTDVDFEDNTVNISENNDVPQAAFAVATAKTVAVIYIDGSGKVFSGTANVVAGDDTVILREALAILGLDIAGTSVSNFFVLKSGKLTDGYKGTYVPQNVSLSNPTVAIYNPATEREISGLQLIAGQNLHVISLKSLMIQVGITVHGLIRDSEVTTILASKNQELPKAYLSPVFGKASMAVGESQQLYVLAVNPVNTVYTANWDSSNTSVAVVDQGGKLVAKAAGKTTVSVSFGGQRVYMGIEVILLPNELNNSMSAQEAFDLLKSRPQFTASESWHKVSGNHATLGVTAATTLKIDSSWDVFVTRNGVKGAALTNQTVSLRGGDTVELWKLVKEEVTPVPPIGTVPTNPPVTVTPEVPAVTQAAELKDSQTLKEGYDALMKLSNVVNNESNIDGNHAIIRISGPISLKVGATWDVYLTSANGAKTGPHSNKELAVEKGSWIEIWKVGVVTPASGVFTVEHKSNLRDFFNAAVATGAFDAEWSKDRGTHFVLVAARGAEVNVDLSGRIAYLQKAGEAKSARVYGNVTLHSGDTLECWWAPTN